MRNLKLQLHSVSSPRDYKKKFSKKAPLYRVASGTLPYSYDRRSDNLSFLKLFRQTFDVLTRPSPLSGNNDAINRFYRDAIRWHVINWADAIIKHTAAAATAAAARWGVKIISTHLAGALTLHKITTHHTVTLHKLDLKLIICSATQESCCVANGDIFQISIHNYIGNRSPKSNLAQNRWWQLL